MPLPKNQWNHTDRGVLPSEYNDKFRGDQNSQLHQTVANIKFNAPSQSPIEVEKKPKYNSWYNPTISVANPAESFFPQHTQFGAPLPYNTQGTKPIPKTIPIDNEKHNANNINSNSRNSASSKVVYPEVTDHQLDFSNTQKYPDRPVNITYNVPPRSPSTSSIENQEEKQQFYDSSLSPSSNQSNSTSSERKVYRPSGRRNY
jgi:hypothetical protein